MADDDFDPVAYLQALNGSAAATASSTLPPPGAPAATGTDDFDPVAYLQTLPSGTGAASGTVPVAPGYVWDVIRSIPGAAVRGFSSAASAMGKAAAYEQSQPELAEQIPGPEESARILEHNVTGPLPEPQTAPGRIASSAIEGIVAGGPASFMGPSGPLEAALATGLSGAGSEAAGEAVHAVAPALEPEARIIGGLGPSLADVRKALQVARTPEPIPPESGFTFTKGEETGDLALRQREASAMRDLGNARAQQFVAQRQEQLPSVREGVAAQIGGPQVVASPQDAADIISQEMIGRRRTLDQGLQQQGADIAADTIRYHEDLSPGRPPVSDPMQAANVVSSAIAGRAQQAQAAIDAAYDQLRQLPGRFHPATFNNIENIIRQRATAGPDPTIINAQTTPITNAALGDLDDVISGLKQNRDPESGRILPRPPITPQVVENARKRLNSFYGQALQAAKASNNWSDARTMRQVMGIFDDYVAGRLQAGTFTGGDASGVLDAMQNARRLYADYRQTFTPQGQGDSVGKAIQAVLGRPGGQPATPEQVVNLLYNGPSAPKVAQRLVQMFGPDSPEIGAVRQGYISHMLEPDPGKPPLNARQIADRIDAVTGGGSRQPPTLTSTYFDPARIKDLQAIGQRLRQHYTAVNPALDEAGELAEAISGGNGEAPAGNADVVQRLFQRTMRGDEVPATFMTQLSPSGQAAFKTGLFRYAAAPVAGIPDWGPKQTGDRLYNLLNATRNTSVYTPSERGLIAGYADLMRKITMPTRAYAPSELAIMRLGSAVASRLGGIVGAIIGHALSPFPLVGELAGYTVGRQAEKIIENRLDQASRQLPLVSEQMAKYQKALAAYQKAQNLGTGKLLTNAGTNLVHAVAPLGISPDQLQ